MINIFKLPVVAAIIACVSATSPVEPTLRPACNGCTKEYSPVCAFRYHNDRVEFQTFGNDCMRKYENCDKRTSKIAKKKTISIFHILLVFHIFFLFFSTKKTILPSH